MADNPPVDPPIAPPVVPAQSAPQTDAGIVSWRMQLERAIESTPGVEMTGGAGGTLSFRFRGQTFMVNVYRTT